MTRSSEKAGSLATGINTNLANSWFALRVKSRREKFVSRILSNKGFEQFLPVHRSKRQWADRVKHIDFPLFPGYVFCRFQPEACIAVLRTPGVVEIVRCGQTFAAVDPAEIATLRAQMKSVDRAPEFYRALVPNIIGLLGPHALKTSGTADLLPFRLNTEQAPETGGQDLFLRNRQRSP